jgi:hypothetical protein
MNICNIIESHLRANGFTGLYNTEINCGCEIDDLMPCGECEILRDCEPGYKVPCTDKCEHEESFQEGDWHIQQNKPDSDSPASKESK